MRSVTTLARALRAGLGVAPLAALALALSGGTAHAVTLGFDCLTNTIAGDCAIGEAQLQVVVTDEGGGTVRFRFENLGPADSVISEVYFDDGSLLVLSAVNDGAGVDFEPDANPPDLPGGNLAVPPFQVTQGFLAEAIPAPSMNGVGPTEWVEIDFSLQGGQSFADVLDELDSGALRIGIHVIAFESGGSESFLNMPEPGTGLLIGAGLLLACVRARRR